MIPIENAQTIPKQPLRTLLVWEKPFVRMVVLVALPMVLQNLLSSSLSVVDSIMVASLGDQTLAAVSQAGRIMFLLQLALFGMGSGTSILLAQYFGAGNEAAIRRTTALGLQIMLVISVIFFLAVQLFGHQLMGLFFRGEDVAVRELSLTYLRAVSPAYLSSAVCVCFSSALKCVRKATLAMACAMIAVALNTTLTYALIHGAWIFPKWGVTGAGIATVAASLTEMTLLLIVTYWGRLPGAIRLADFRFPGRAFMGKYVKLVTPVFLNEFFWALGVTAYALVYGQLGADTLAGVALFGNLEQLSGAFFFGLMNATAVIVGNTLGKGDFARGWLYSKRMLLLTVAMAISACLTMTLLRYQILAIFTQVSPDVRDIAAQLALVFMVVAPFKALNSTNVVGILRSGGDALFTMLVDMLGVWGIGIPMAIVGGLVFKLPVHWVYLMLSSEEMVKTVLGMMRFRSRKWMRNLTRDSAEAAVM